MTLLRLIFGLAIALAVQATLGRIWPATQRYADVMLVPVIWYGIGGAQRKAMFVGCAAGLLQDAWFQLGVFGLNGFKKTLLGWILGGLGSRFDVNRQSGRMVFGLLASLADSMMDIGLRRLLEQNQAVPSIVDILVKAVVTGLLVVGTFHVIERVRRRRELRYLG